MNSHSELKYRDNDNQTAPHMMFVGNGNPVDLANVHSRFFETDVGVRLNFGKMRVGNKGSLKKRKSGPLGSEVSIASRVQGAARFLQAPALLSSVTAQHLDGKFNT